MAWWAMAGDWSAKAVDQYLGVDSQRKANLSNVRLQRENQNWMKMMSDTSVQRRVADLKAAGLNPMLGYSDSASSPSSGPAHVESTYSSGKEAALPRLQEAMLMKATTEKLRAEARSANADAIQKEALIPYSGKMADMTFSDLSKRVDLLTAEVAGKRIENMQASELKPLIVKYQELVNQAEKLGLSEKAAMADFYDSVGGAAKWIEIVRQFMPGVGMLLPLTSGKGAARNVRGAVRNSSGSHLPRVENVPHIRQKFQHRRDLRSSDSNPTVRRVYAPE